MLCTEQYLHLMINCEYCIFRKFFALLRSNVNWPHNLSQLKAYCSSQFIILLRFVIIDKNDSRQQSFYHFIISTQSFIGGYLLMKLRTITEKCYTYSFDSEFEMRMKICELRTEHHQHLVFSIQRSAFSM